MKRTFLKYLSLTLITFLAAAGAQAKSDKAATKVDGAVWANGDLYNVVVTTNSFKHAPEHALDVIYNFSMSGLEGQRSISESAPGDTDYNGGRWHVVMVLFTDQGKAVHDPDDDGIVNFELTDADMVMHHVELGHLILMDTDIRFSCPLAGLAE